MLLNQLEFLMMNNPIRRLIQERVEIIRLRKFSDLGIGKKVLEIGCGNGNGTTLIHKYFRPKQIFALDLDPKMIKLAKKRLIGADVQFEVGNVTKLPYPNNSFDAVFGFGVIHHIPNWRDCILEIKRVLKPGGELIIEDFSIETFSTPFGRLLRRLFIHPYDLMFSQSEFLQQLQTDKFRILRQKIYDVLGLFKYFIVVAKK